MGVGGEGEDMRDKRRRGRRWGGGGGGEAR